MKFVLILGILITTTACATSELSETNDNQVPMRPIREVLSGNWAPSPDLCEEAPLYSFSSDGAVMHVTSDSPRFLSENGEEFYSLNYQILAASNRVLRAVIEGEERRTDAGNVVVWDLILLNEDAFCWRRTDWDRTSCTVPRMRCANAL